MTFELKESGIHDYAKVKIQEWTSHMAIRGNRGGSWLEYPIIKNAFDAGLPLLDEYFLFRYDKNGKIGNYNTRCCDEIPQKILEKYWTKQKGGDYVPTYDYCVKMGEIPVAIVDVALPYKGGIYEIWEITYKNKLTQEKVDKIYNIVKDSAFGEPTLYEISAEWVIKQNIHDDFQTLHENAIKHAKRWF